MSREHTSVMPEQSFVVIKYGDDQEALINPWCSTHTFVQWIRRICHCANDITLDLVDLEGQVKNLPMTSEEYACDYVNGRETYVVIRVEKQGDYGPNRYISMLENLDQWNPELLVKLNSLSRPGTRNSRRDRQKKTPTRGSRNHKGENKGRPSSSERKSRYQGK